MNRGLLLFAHGARDPDWARPFELVAQRVQQLRPDAVVRLGFLEFMRPSLAEAADSLLQLGCLSIDVMPLFLGQGGHVRKDLPLLLDALRRKQPQVGFTLHPAIGEMDSVIEAMALAAAGKLDGGL